MRDGRPQRRSYSSSKQRQRRASGGMTDRLQTWQLRSMFIACRTSTSKRRHG